MPKLVMDVTVESNGCNLAFRKPIRLDTVTTILETPVRHTPPDHSACSDGVPAESRARVKDECDQHVDRGISPVTRILSVDLADGAYIRSDSDQIDTSTRFEIFPYGARLTASGADNDRSGIPETALTLLKMTTLQSEAQQSRSMEQDRALYLKRRDRGPRCHLRPRYSPYHLSLEVTDTEADSFVDQVSCL